jgi:hypothetical protein
VSLTPIFDATLADAPRNIWQASNIFPYPPFKVFIPKTAETEAIDWSKFAQTPIVPMADPANLTFLRDAGA